MVQTVLNPSTAGDTTVHFELDVAEDIEGYIEEFSYLKRLGNFEAAEKYFQSNLQDYIDILPITVEYADMLLEQGAYKRLVDFYDKQTLLDDDFEDAARFSYNVNLKLIGVCATIYADGLTIHRLHEVRNQKILLHMEMQESKTNYYINSIEVQIIRRWLEIVTRFRMESNLAHYSYFSEICHNWTRLYGRLLDLERIWDVRDIISASIGAFGPAETWQNLFHEDIHTRGSFDKFLDDWKVEEYDACTHLAMLDIFVSLGRSFVSRLFGPTAKEVLPTAKRCLQHARDLATAIGENSPEHLKSRPYIQWIVVEEELARRLAVMDEGTASNNKALNPRYLNNFPGLTLWESSLPIYVPARSENPGWPTSSLPLKSDKLLQTALRASRELGDYRTEVMCLRELICHSQEPYNLFTQLIHLQKSIQGDRSGALQTCLTKYLLATDDSSLGVLKNEISATHDGGGFEHNSTTSPLIDWCAEMIKSALCRSLGLDPKEVINARNAAKLEILPYLPPHLKDDIYKAGVYRDLPSDVNDFDQSDRETHFEVRRMRGRSRSKTDVAHGPGIHPRRERPVYRRGHRIDHSLEAISDNEEPSENSAKDTDRPQEEDDRKDPSQQTLAHMSKGPPPKAWVELTYPSELKKTENRQSTVRALSEGTGEAQVQQCAKANPEPQEPDEAKVGEENKHPESPDNDSNVLIHLEDDSNDPSTAREKKEDQSKSDQQREEKPLDTKRLNVASVENAEDSADDRARPHELTE
ncbi:hypothetical protein VTN00DRAFT_3533 [Thermoascus crustaceus]|uniref:uncharacterized protein n=1 Tax=Thermoascus crustaceus TaxID=5088 RepID=UPI0037429D25